MKANSEFFPIKVMAKVLEVSRSGYYNWLLNKPVRRSIDDLRLKPLILNAHKRSRETYGPKRLQVELAEQGFFIGRDRISRLRKELNLKCIQRQKFKATTNSNHNRPVAENLLNQNFQTVGPGLVLGTDITYIGTDEGWLYLAGVKDFHTKQITGYAMAASMSKELVREAMRRALSNHKILPGCIAHSDRGSQYCSHEYLQDLDKAGIKPSMSRRGNCYDNAPTESFWGALKTELVYQRRFKTRTQAEAAVREYIEVFYNRIRRHSKIGNLAPAIFAERSKKQR
jgi:transposase InsO family protein